MPVVDWTETLTDSELNATFWHFALPHTAAAVPMARALVRTALTEIDATVDHDTAELLTAELVANAVQHTSGDEPIRLVVKLLATCWQVEVHDPDPAPPDGLGSPGVNCLALLPQLQGPPAEETIPAAPSPAVPSPVASAPTPSYAAPPSPYPAHPTPSPADHPVRPPAPAPRPSSGPAAGPVGDCHDIRAIQDLDTPDLMEIFDPQEVEECGRGLLLIRTLSADSGYRATPYGKAVWFTLPTSGR